MAIVFVKRVGEFASGVNGTTLTVTVPAGGVAKGHRLLIGICTSNADTDGAFTASDTKGNTYVVDQDPLTAVGRRTVAMSALVTTALVSGDVITVTQPATDTQRGCDVLEFSGLGPKDVGTADSGNNGTPSSGATATRSKPNSLIFGVCGWNSSAGTDAFTAGTNFTGANTVNAGSATTWRNLGTEYRIVSAVGTDAATGTIPSNQWHMLAVVYSATEGAGGLVNRQPLMSLVNGGLAR